MTENNTKGDLNWPKKTKTKPKWSKPSQNKAQTDPSKLELTQIDINN